MALSPAEAWDPVQFHEEADRWEPFLDKFLQKNFDGRRERIKMRPSDGPRRHISREAARELIRRFEAVGWKVEWDGDCELPWFYFEPKKRIR